ncbi:MAG: hypothetical protein GY869_30935 [Planctomycetes bacterium]|nr:hypothetical protein [Planctomycetota bacterium]
MSEELTELLIGKFLDSEITPAEQQLLEIELQKNPESQKLLDELKQFHELAAQALDQELNESDTSCEEIFQRASAQVPDPKKQRIIRFNLWQKAASIAAMLMIGFSVYLVLVQSNQVTNMVDTQIEGATLPPVPSRDGEIAINQDQTSTGTIQPVRYGPPGSDFYYVRSPDGTEWLIQKSPQNQIRRASYNGEIH